MQQILFMTKLKVYFSFPRFTYQAVVYEGKGINTTIPPLATLDGKEPPLLINPDRLVAVPLDSMFTIGVRLKTVDVI